MKPNMDYSVTENICKRDAAARQLDVAIKLWFNGEDPVAIHTLACSAYQIVHDLCPEEELLYRSLVFKEEYRKKAIRQLKSSYNFFKHANEDPNGVIEFKPVSNEGFIIFSLMGLVSLGIKPSIPRAAFYSYFLLTADSSLLTEKAKTDVLEESRHAVRSMSKAEFFEWFAEHWKANAG